MLDDPTHAAPSLTTLPPDALEGRAAATQDGAPYIVRLALRVAAGLESEALVHGFSQPDLLEIARHLNAQAAAPAGDEATLLHLLATRLNVPQLVSLAGALEQHHHLLSINTVLTELGAFGVLSSATAQPPAWQPDVLAGPRNPLWPPSPYWNKDIPITLAAAAPGLHSAHDVAAMGPAAAAAIRRWSAQCPAGCKKKCEAATPEACVARHHDEDGGDAGHTSC